MLKLNIFILWKIIMRFHVDCRPQIRIVYFKSQCNRWNEALGSGSMGSWLSVLEFGNQSKLRANRRNTRRSEHCMWNLFPQLQRTQTKPVKFI